ncbi:MAG: hypothetical protein JXP73_18445 [Deltaproteobacteria bacterium]|nr:hypothetical protein [Deltaproteobacteria bacterium]
MGSGCGSSVGTPRKDAAQAIDAPISSGGTGGRLGSGGVRGTGGVWGGGGVTTMGGPGGSAGAGGVTIRGAGGRHTGGTAAGDSGGTVSTRAGGARTGGMPGGGGTGTAGVVSGGAGGTGAITPAGGSGAGGSKVTALDAADLADSGASCSPDAVLACSRGYFQTSATANPGICADDSVAPTCDNGTWTCPAGSIPTSQCTVALCPSTLPSGACTPGDVFSCSGYLYPYTNVICECLTGTWQCLM